MDRFRSMEMFVALVEAGSFSRAAELHGTTKSTLSRNVRELELWLGAELVDRTDRRIRITEAGRVFYEQCRQIVVNVERLPEHFEGASSMTGNIRVSLPGSLGVVGLGSTLNAFCDEYPEIMLELEFGDRRIRLLEWNIDVGVRIGRQTDVDYVAQPLFRVHHLLCATPEYWSQFGFPTTPDELSTHRALRQSWIPNPEVWPYRSASGGRGSVQVPIRLLSGSGTHLRQAAMAGLGISLQPTFLIADDVAAGRLQPALTDHSWSRVSAFVLTRPPSLQSQRARVFADFLRERFQNGTPWDTKVQGLISA